MEDGFIILSRKILRSWINSNPYYLSWFMQILMNANYKPTKKLNYGRFVTIERGELLISYRQFAMQLAGCSVQKLKTFLRLLVESETISIEVRQRATVIKILNYEQYQNPNTGNKEKGLEPIIKTNTKTNELKKEYLEFVNWYNSNFNRKFKALESNFTKFKTAIKSFSIDEIKKATENMYNSQYHRETDFKYLTIEFSLRSDKIDKFLNVQESIAVAVDIE